MPVAPGACVLALALLVAACGSTASRDPWPGGGGPPSAEVVGWLDDRPVTYGDVARFLQTKEPESFARGLEGLVIERVTMLEASPLGVTAPRALVARESSRRMREWEARVREASRAQTGEEVDPALWLQRVAGVSVAELRSWVEHHTEIELVQDRLLRYEMLTSPRVEVSLLVVADEGTARALKARAEGGEDFGVLARANSIHPSAPEEGRVPYPLLPADIAGAPVRDALFAAKAGEIVGPFRTGSGERAAFQLYRIESTSPAMQGTYAELAREITRDLEARPVHVGEYERWRTRILLRHGFLAAAGEIDDSAP